MTEAEKLARVKALAAEIIEVIDEEEPPPPVDDSLPVATARVVGTSATLTWTTTRADITSFVAGRDGTDASGSGPWSTELPAGARSHTFNLLRPGATYRLSLTARVAAGPLAPVTVLVAIPSAPPVDPPVDPEDPPVDPPAGDTAAARFGWGTPHPISDEFNYTGTPDPAKWQMPGAGGWDGHAGNGRRMPENVFVANGIMTLRGDANGNTGWVRQKLTPKYGRWEIRSRSRNTGASGGLYHPLHLIWPATERWPVDGEYDFMEYFDPSGNKVGGFLHYPHPNLPVQQEQWSKTLDVTQWHNYAFEWTKDGLKGWVDGVQVFSFSGGANSSRRNIQDMPSGALTHQLDNFTGDGGLRPAVLEIEFSRFYPVA